MAIALASSLSAHQKSNARRPALTAAASNKRADVHLLRWERWYTGSESDSPCAVAIAPDGSLLRVRNESGSIRAARVASPSSGSTYSTWLTYSTTATAGAGVAVAARTGEALLAYVDSAGLKLQLRTSTDNGATWGAASLIVTEASAIGSLALCFRSNGDACVFYTLGTSTTLKRLRRTAGVWDASGTNWSKSASVASITGVAAACASGDYAVVVTGTAVTSTDKRVWLTTLGNGGGGFTLNTWFGLGTIAQADSLSTISYKAPAAAYVGDAVHAFFAVHESANVAYDRTYYSHSPSDTQGTGAWSEPFPFEATGASGTTLAARGGDVFAVRPDGVWHATINQQSDLSERILSCSWEHTTTSARLQQELDNHDAAVASLSGLTAGGQLVLTPGYHSGTGGAIQTGTSLVFSVDSITNSVQGGRRIALVRGSGPWERAERWRTPQAVQYAATLTRDVIFSNLATRAEAYATENGSDHPPSSDFTGYSPAFGIAAGESAATSLKRLLAVVTDYAIPSGISLPVRGTSPLDTADWSIGAAAHPYTQLQLIEEAQPHNWVRLQGPDRYADSVAEADGYRYGGALRVLRELDATTDPKATAWAANAARRDAIEQERGSFVAPFHAGIELLDVVQVAAPELGLAATDYRVIKIGMIYTRDGKNARFDTTATLGGV
jgi:hypothetical protein